MWSSSCRWHFQHPTVLMLPVFSEEDYHHEARDCQLLYQDLREESHCCSYLCSEAQAYCVRCRRAPPGSLLVLQLGVRDERDWMKRLSSDTGQLAQTCPIAPWLHRFQED